MTKNNYNPKGQVDTFLMMKSLEKGEPGAIQLMLSTHPLTSERIAEARRRVEKTPASLRDKPLRVKTYDRMLARQRERAPAYAAMDAGDGYLKNRQYGQALAKYRDAAGLFPKEGLFYTKAAFCELSRRDFHAAAKYGQTAARLSPDLFLARFVAGYSKIRIGKAAEAVGDLDRAVRILPDNALANYVLAAAYEKSGDRPRASVYYRKTVQLDPQGRYRQSGLSEAARAVGRDQGEKKKRG